MPTLVQSVTGSVGLFTLPSAPTGGNTLLAWFACRIAGGGAAMATPDGFTRIKDSRQNVTGDNGGAMFYRPVQPGDDATWGYLGTVIGLLMEWSGATVDESVKADDQNAESMQCGGSVTPTAGVPAVIVGGGAIGEFDPVIYSVAPDADVTELVDSYPGQAPTIWCGYRSVSSTSGAYSVGGMITESTGTGRFQYSGVTVALIGEAPVPDPGIIIT